MQAIILAGGGGTRLQPLTLTTPKPLLPVANRPCLQRAVEHLAACGFSDILLTTHYLAPHINRWLREWTPPISVRCVLEAAPLGTAGCVKAALPFLDSEFLVAPGDVVCDADLGAFVATHRARRAVASLGAIRVPDTRQFGILETDDMGRIRRFQEKPAQHEAFSNLTNAGYYWLHRDVFDLVPEGEPFDFSRELFPRLLEENAPFFAQELPGFWADIGTAESYLAANRFLLNGDAHLEASAKVSPHATLKAPYFIGANCEIEAGAIIGPGTILGEACRVEAHAQLVESVLHRRVTVGENAQLNGCAVGDNGRIGARVRIETGAVIGAGGQLAEDALVPANTRLQPCHRFDVLARH